MDNTNERPEDRFVGYIGEGIDNESLQCSGCRHCMPDSVLECEIYSQKPSGVLNGSAQCEDYEGC